MNLFLIPQVILAILLTIVILLQTKGSGIGSAWGGSGVLYRTRRGAERVLFVSTIVLSVLFLGLSIVIAIS